MKIITIVVIFLVVGFTYLSYKAQLNSTSTKVIYTTKAPKPIGSYSQAIETNGTLYISGQIAINPETNQLDTNNLNIEVSRVLSNVNAILTEAGYEKSNVVKVSVYLKDLGKFQEFNQYYSQYFQENKPARETIGVASLPKNVNIEISAIAVK